jgi:hypothetical protein
MLSNQGTSNHIEFYQSFQKPIEKECEIIDIDLHASDFKKRGKFSEIYKNKP